ncbi:MAG: prefoldin subunit alpha [Candidatus Nitrosoabyssus spongiisocia]|nr:MAG: prefoldin subunit alpha [Nitrosopumilaceae archaeon AB1(1)]
MSERGQQLAQELQMMESYYSDILKQESMLSTTLKYVADSIDSLRAFDMPELEVFAPLGPGIHVKAKIKQDDKILVDVGTGMAIEKDRDAALSYLEMRIKTLTVGLREVTTKKQSVVDSMENMRHEAANLATQKS